MPPRRKRFPVFLLLLPLLLQLSGCAWRRGSTGLEIVYPSGYARGCYTWENGAPVEGTGLRLCVQPGENYPKPRNYAVQVLDGADAVLWEAACKGYLPTLRGEAAEDGGIWITGELWETADFCGYISNCMSSGTLWLADAGTGETLFRRELGENELFLTAVGPRCYFYDCGREDEKALFGLITLPQRNAEIYYRERDDWKERTTVYTFDYAVQPDKLDEGSVEDQIRFYLGGETLTVSMTAYVQVDKKENHWEHVEVRCIEIPFS